MGPRVLYVEDEPLLAQTACAALNRAGFTTLPPVHHSAEAVDAVVRGQPDVILLDIKLDREGDGIDLAARLRSVHPVPIVFVSGYSDRETVARALGQSPSGFVVKPFHPEQLVTAVHMALARGADGIDTSKLPGVELLTPREREILEALLTGRRISGIAEAADVSVHTVRNQVKSIMTKLGVHSQDELVARFRA